jgi:LysM repeat protein
MMVKGDGINLNKMKKIIASSLAAGVILGLAGNGLVLAQTNTDKKESTTSSQIMVDLNDTAPAALKPIFVYSINKGDTLWGLSKKFRITLSKLLEMNPQLKISKPLFINQKVLVPALQMTDPLFIYFMINEKPIIQPAPQPAAQPAVKTTVKPTMKPSAQSTAKATVEPAVKLPAASYQMHVVKKGETLYSIAKAYDLSIDLLEKENRISSHTYLKIGDQLLIPTQNRMVSYQVQSGDTLTRIAKKFHTTLQAIVRDNSLKSNSIIVGQTLNISQK